MSKSRFFVPDEDVICESQSVWEIFEFCHARTHKHKDKVLAKIWALHEELKSQWFREGLRLDLRRRYDFHCYRSDADALTAFFAYRGKKEVRELIKKYGSAAGLIKAINHYEEYSNRSLPYMADGIFKDSDFLLAWSRIGAI